MRASLGENEQQALVLKVSRSYCWTGS